MKRELILLLLIIAFITCSAGTSSALPIVNVSGDGTEDVAGIPYAYYQNSGMFMFIGEYNNEGGNLPLVQADVISWLNLNLPSYDTTDFTLVDTTNAVTVTGVNQSGVPIELGASASGTYAVNTDIYPLGIEFYAVKAGRNFAMYLELGGETYGSWSTYDLWVDKGRGELLEVSHFTGYNGSGESVPEPATMLLFGTGLMGLIGFSRKLCK